MGWHRWLALVRDVLFMYVTPVLSLGAQRPLVEDDIPSLGDNHATLVWHHAFNRAWQPGTSLLRALLQVRDSGLA
jgi:hypothetical protein